MLSKCDHCQHEFQVDGFLIEDMPDGIEKTYFDCPNCNHRYTCFYTDAKIRQTQAMIRNMRGTKVGLDAKRDTLVKQNKEAMNKLRQRMEGSL